MGMFADIASDLFPTGELRSSCRYLSGDAAFIFECNRMRLLGAFSILSLFQCGGQMEGEKPTTAHTQLVGGPCDGCELLYEGKPATLGPVLQLAPDPEPGEDLVIEGLLVHVDGITPAENVTLYIYHTDAKDYTALGRTRPMAHGTATYADGSEQVPMVISP